MGKSLKGKELGKGITQRKDGLYQGRFTNRFGKKETVYGNNLNDVRQKLRTKQYEDENKRNVIKQDVTLDEWFDIWMNTCKKNCQTCFNRGSCMYSRSEATEENRRFFEALPVTA